MLFFLQRTLPIFLSCFCLCLSECQSQEKREVKELDLDTAVFRVLQRSPMLSLANYEAQSRRHQITQAQALPNPEFNYEIENFAGNNEWQGWQNREERYYTSQLFETGNKRKFRSEAALYQYYASLVGYDVSKLVLLNRLNRAFILVVAYQEYLKMSQDQLSIAQEMHEIATKKVAAGKIAFLQKNKAEIAYSSSLITLQKATTNLRNAKRRLALLWADNCPDFVSAVFPFYFLSEPEPFEKCLVNLCNQSEIVQAIYLQLNSERIWQLEKANRYPNVTLQMGYKGNLEEKNQGLLASLSIPIPLFNQNRGNIGKAYFDMLKTGEEGRQLWLILESKLINTYEELVQAFQEAQIMEKVSIPLAEQAYDLAQKGYREGKFAYLDVLDAQRSLFEIKEKFIQTLIDYHTKRADIDYLNSQMD